MFLTSEQTGGPRIFSLRQSNRYLALEGGLSNRTCDFGIEQLAEVLKRKAGDTWQEHSSLILLACMEGKLFEWLDEIGGVK